MTIIELGALGEFVSSVAVLLTLVYLAVQVRQTKQTVQSSSHQTGIATMTQNNQSVYKDKELSNIIIKGLFDDDLDPTEWFRFGLGACRCSMYSNSTSSIQKRGWGIQGSGQERNVR